jgi:hypothetical protein
MALVKWPIQAGFGLEWAIVDQNVAILLASEP